MGISVVTFKGIIGISAMLYIGENRRARDEKTGKYQTYGGSMRHNF